MKKAVIVAAQPDDEALWFCSIMEKVEHVIRFLGVPSNETLSEGGKAKHYRKASVAGNCVFGA